MTPRGAPLRQWSDLRHLLAAGRALEEAMGAALVERHGDGVLTLSPLGRAVFEEAEAIEARIAALAALTQDDREAVRGVVRLTAAPILVSRLLAPAAGALLEAHPALRLARPTSGGGSVKARRIGHLAYGLFAARDCAAAEDAATPLIGYGTSMAHLPPAAWLEDAAARHAPGLAPIALNDAEAMLEGAALGLGLALLPSRVAKGDPRLCPASLRDLGSPPARELWLVAHEDQRATPRIAAVVDWLREVVADD